MADQGAEPGKGGTTVPYIRLRRTATGGRACARRRGTVVAQRWRSVNLLSISMVIDTEGRSDCLAFAQVSGC